jgi:anti-anti-sigma regulatory factor
VVAVEQLAAAEQLKLIPLDEVVGWRLVGEVDLATRGLLSDALDAVIRPGRTVHLELTELFFIDVGGVTVLVNRAGRLAPGGRLILHHPPGTLRRIYDVLWDSRPEIEMDIS